MKTSRLLGARENAATQSRLYFSFCIWLVERMARVSWTNHKTTFGNTKTIRPDYFRNSIKNWSKDDYVEQFIIFYWALTVIWDCIGFALPRFVIGPENSGHPFNQSVEKLKPIANLFIRIFSHFRNFVNCLARVLIMMFPFVPINLSYFFSQFWLYNPRSKIALQDCTSRKWKGHMIDGTYFCNAQNIYPDQTLLT